MMTLVTCFDFFALYINETALESILLIEGKVSKAECTFTNFIFAAELRQNQTKKLTCLCHFYNCGSQI